MIDECVGGHRTSPPLLFILKKLIIKNKSIIKIMKLQQVLAHDVKKIEMTGNGVDGINLVTEVVQPDVEK